jgi:hypothetical protein
MKTEDVAALDEDERMDLARGPGLSTALQRVLSRDPDRFVRRELATHPALEPEVQHVLVRDADTDMRHWLAERNPALAIDVQRELAKYRVARTQMCLARNRGLDPKIQRLLAKSKDQHVRSDLAANPTLELEAQVMLAGDKSLTVRSWLARNKALAPEVELLLAGDDVLVLYHLVANKGTGLTSSFPVRGLDAFDEGRDLVTEHLEQSGLDTEDLDALRSGWEGTLGELLETAKDFAATPA